jgi:hypothetical protein
LPQGVLDRLDYLRGPGQSYSDVIVRLVASESARQACRRGLRRMISVFDDGATAPPVCRSARLRIVR